jgi:hypothetical protein
MFCKRRHYKKPYMFRSSFHDHLQGSSLVLSASTTFKLPASSFVFFGFVAVCPLFVCVPGVPVCVLSGRAKHDQTTHSQVNRAHIQIEGIARPDNTQTGTSGTHKHDQTTQPGTPGTHTNRGHSTTRQHTDRYIGHT